MTRAARGADGIFRTLGADDTLFSESRDVVRNVDPPEPRPTLRPCDGPDCTTEPAFYCGCKRCDREPADEAFFSCIDHIREATEKHRRIYPGHRPAWFGGGEAARARYLAPR